LSILRPKPENRHPWFLGQAKKIIATDFEDKSKKTIATGFKAKSEKTVSVILRLNR
jgi:hypothetical protein